MRRIFFANKNRFEAEVRESEISEASTTTTVTGVIEERPHSKTSHHGNLFM
jgi:hypothetical protein